MAAQNQVQGPSKIKQLQDFGVQYAIYLVFVVLVLVIAIKEPAFLSLNNFRNILTMSATRIIIAMGMGAILITGGVDLSAGRQVGLAAVLSASLLQNLDYPRRMYPDMPILPLLIPILAAMAACGIFGFLNGFFIAKLKLPAFIATLGSMVAVYGVNSLYFDRPPYGAQPIGGLDRRFSTLGSGYIGFDGLYSIPYIVIIAVVVTLITYVLFNKTTYGKNIYAIGGNAEAAKVSGVNVNRTLILVYTIAGILFGLGGTLEAARTGGATNNYGNGYELDAIAACVVGGVSNLGGIGTVPGIVIGVLIFSVINYGLTFINMSPYWQQIVKGAIIIAAVAIDIRKYLKKR
ncbi:galactose/methyl galactoside ABC transporter permease MglC [Treponema primitia]|uniref:galactose/methyl galactoside ABC transporter permease MglC n=1 Tax=Treponema primitia TaxID=88058 RepID=UPI0002555812|nr:galactose/methyl galactoside ABC transporter permease MglC [Treponema primitia]